MGSCFEGFITRNAMVQSKFNLDAHFVNYRFLNFATNYDITLLFYYACMHFELQQRDVPTPDDVRWASDGATEISTEAVQFLPRPIYSTRPTFRKCKTQVGKDMECSRHSPPRPTRRASCCCCSLLAASPRRWSRQAGP